MTAAVVAVAALAGTTSAGADGNGVIASASGGYGFAGTVLGGPIEVHPFAWNVQLLADGSAHGRFQYTQVRNGVFLMVRGTLTCATFDGNRVWVGGVIDDSSRASLIGLDMWFQAQDNGEPGSDVTADMSSTIGAGPPGTGQQYCDDAPPVMFPFLIEQGNLQVRS
ncbi:MAG TPA: hypothetical protein VE444_02350 [Gaiellaceae bacterium]|nr:hypothetical protein [Gaiellaceae bacterium]